MAQAVQFTTTVLPDGRIQLPPGCVSAGETVEVTLNLKQQTSANPPTDILEFLNSLPPGPRSCATWEEFEEEFRKERESWDR
jgi:hypothetical protein